MPPTTRTAPRDWIETAPLNDSIRKLARRGELCRFAKGAVLIQEGSLGDTLYIVLAGQLRVFTSSMVTEREFTFSVYGPGEYVGEMGLDGGPRSASVMATEPTVCAMVTRQTLLQFLRDEPDFALELLAKVIRRARMATLSAKNMALNDVYGRLKHLLESSAQPQADGSLAVAEKLTHKELANRLGCSREMVTRLLKDLQDGRYVALVDGRLALQRPLPPRW